MSVWTPDGKHILFLSSRSGTIDLWAVGVSEGKPVGTPFLVKRSVSDQPIGVSTAGDYAYFTRRPAPEHVTLASFEAERDTLPRLAEPLFGIPALWSPDGQAIVVLRENNNQLVVRWLENGSETLLGSPWREISFRDRLSEFFQPFRRGPACARFRAGDDH